MRSASTSASEAATDTTEAQRLREELAQCRDASDTARFADAARIRVLESELADASADRIRREKQWLSYTQAITKLGAIAVARELPPGDPALARAVETSAAAASERADDHELASSTDAASARSTDDAAASRASAKTAPEAQPPVTNEKRDREIFLALRSLFVIEQVSGFDLLESGTLRGGTTGPVVLRVLDDRGHPLGTLYAEHLRLEASRAARTLTLVLEDGFERVHGEKLAFDALPHSDSVAPDAGASVRDTASPAAAHDAVARNARRVVLPAVDPRQWIEALPELFKESEREPPPDDGRWEIGALRAALNDLLRVDSAGGYYRIQGIGGVRGDTLHDILLEHLDRGGRLERNLFADRMRVIPGDAGVVIVLEGGAQVRGDEKTPFLDGRFRIFLPRADLDEWRKAGVPGLSPAPPPPAKRR